MSTATASLLVLLGLAGATPLMAESHPSWWTYASPGATALVGVDWGNLRQTPFAAAAEAVIFGKDGLNFPQLACLKQGREMLISSPELLAAESGDFPAPTVSQQARNQGLRRIVYKETTLWIAPGKGLGIAQINDNLVLIGARKALQTALDDAETNRNAKEEDRHYSPLLARAARFSQNTDLWVVAASLPDPLAGLFVPLDAPGQDFEGFASLRSGLTLSASWDAGSADAAADFAGKFGADEPSLPEIARGIQVTTDGTHVDLALSLTDAQLADSLRSSPGPAPAPAAPAAKPERAPATVAATPASTAPAPESAAPKVIRIYGLDGGPVEIPFQDKPPSR